MLISKPEWNPLEEAAARYPKELQKILLPFKCAREPEQHHEFLKAAIERVCQNTGDKGALDFLTSMDVYFGGWISKNFKEVFEMDFVRPPYKTIKDSYIEDGEKLQAERTALKMLEKNKPMEEIVEFSGLSEERVLELKKKQGK